MKVRYKSNGEMDISSLFNTHGVGEVITCDSSCAYIPDLDVWLESTQGWKDMGQAFRDHDLIIDNHNTSFFEPRDEEERKRGYSL